MGSMNESGTADDDWVVGARMSVDPIADIVATPVPLSGMKYDCDKPDMSLFSPVALTELAKVLSFGKVKYAAHNWRGGISTSRLLAATLRHVLAYLGGENKDPETGLSHIAHAMCCCMFIIELAMTSEDCDDRYVQPSRRSTDSQE